MRIKVRLFASLATRVEGAKQGIPLEVELPPGGDLRHLLSQLRIPESEQKLVFVNGRAEELSVELRDNDEVGIFPPIGGG
jgi:sulfur-carrier protein